MDSNERVYMVDSDALIHMMRLSSLNHKEKKTTRQSSNILDIQTARSTSRNFDASQWIHLLKYSPSLSSFRRLCNERGHSCTWPTGNAPILSKGEKVTECNIENFVPLVAVTKQKTVPSFEFPSGKKRSGGHNVGSVGAIYRRLEEHDASSSTPTAGGAAKHEVVEEKSLGDKISTVVTDAGGDTLAKDTKSKKGIIGSQPRGTRSVYTHFPKDPICEVCKKTTARARCRIKPKKRVDGSALFTQFGDYLITANHKILNVENESGGGHKNALVVQDNFTNWNKSHPMKTKEASQTMSFTKFYSSVTEVGNNSHKSK